MRLGDCRGIVETVNEACTCGGGGPGDCCPACEVYHGIKDMEDGSAEVEKWKRKARLLGEYAAKLRGQLDTAELAGRGWP